MFLSAVFCAIVTADIIPAKQFFTTDYREVIYISLFVCKHSTNTYIHKMLRLLIREGKKSNTREKKRKKEKKIITIN